MRNEEALGRRRWFCGGPMSGTKEFIGLMENPVVGEVGTGCGRLGRAAGVQRRQEMGQKGQRKWVEVEVEVGRVVWREGGGGGKELQGSGGEVAVQFARQGGCQWWGGWGW